MRPLPVLLPLETMAILLAFLPHTPHALVPNLPRKGRTQEDTVGCPIRCNCSKFSPPSRSDPVLALNCTNAGLTNFPPSTPNDTQVLLLSHNRMKNLSSLPPLPNLRLLDLSYNWITFLDNHWVFEHMGLLTRLTLRGNFLRKLQHGSFSGLKNLEELDLSDNNIKTVELHAFGGLNHLSVLHLANNELYELKRTWLLSMTTLRELYLQGNYISVIESNTFDKITSLLHLDLSDNSLQKVYHNGFLGLNRLKLLNVSENSFVDIPTQELRRLSSLDILLMDGIKIDAVKEGDFKDINVSSLSLSFLPNLKVVNRGAFSNMSRLRTLQLHDNSKLLFISPHAFNHVPLLHRLLLHNNELITLSSAIKDSVPRLDELHLYHNPLHCDCNIFWLKRDMESGTEGRYIHDADKLVCNSPVLNDDEVLNIQMPLIHVSIQLLSPVCAPTTLPFFSDTHNVTIGDDLHLQCQAIGVPEPVLSWITPDGRTINASSASHAIISPDNTSLTIQGVQLSDQGTYGCRADNSLGYDTSSTAVLIRNKDLRLSLTNSANDYITVSWAGSIPRLQMSNFQIKYRKNDGREEDYDRVYLHGNMHRCTLTGLQPTTSYEVCIVYRETYRVQCRNFTTNHKVALAQPAITRVDLTRVVAGTCAAVGVVVVLCVARVVLRRLRKRKDYQDPLKEGGEMDKIPLEPIDQRPPDPPLCSSRTALLPHSQI